MGTDTQPQPNNGGQRVPAARSAVTFVSYGVRLVQAAPRLDAPRRSARSAMRSLRTRRREPLGEQVRGSLVAGILRQRGAQHRFRLIAATRPVLDRGAKHEVVLAFAVRIAK